MKLRKRLVLPEPAPGEARARGKTASAAALPRIAPAGAPRPAWRLRPCSITGSARFRASPLFAQAIVLSRHHGHQGISRYRQSAITTAGEARTPYHGPGEPRGLCPASAGTRKRSMHDRLDLATWTNSRRSWVNRYSRRSLGDNEVDRRDGFLRVSRSWVRALRNAPQTIDGSALQKIAPRIAISAHAGPPEWGRKGSTPSRKQTYGRARLIFACAVATETPRRGFHRPHIAPAMPGECAALLLRHRRALSHARARKGDRAPGDPPRVRRLGRRCQPVLGLLIL